MSGTIGAPYAVINSDLTVHPWLTKAKTSTDASIRLGIIRAVDVDSQGRTKYVVQMSKNGKDIGVSCVQMTRFGGVHNFEEYNMRPWVGPSTDPASVGDKAASEYDLRSGDVVVLAYLGGNGREGIILGGVSHHARPEKLQEEEGINYLSCFQGLITSITDDGCYKVTHQGKPTNTSVLEDPPSGDVIAVAEYDEEVAGSYFLFDEKGSFTITDNVKQIIKLKKETGSIVLVSDGRRFEIGAADGFGINKEGLNMLSDDIHMTATNEMNVTATTAFNVTSEAVSINGAKIAIGNSDWELIDQLEKLIELLSAVTLVDSTGGMCLPLKTAAAGWTEVEEWVSTMCSGIKGEITEGEPIESAN